MTLVSLSPCFTQKQPSVCFVLQQSNVRIKKIQIFYSMPIKPQQNPKRSFSQKCFVQFCFRQLQRKELPYSDWQFLWIGIILELSYLAVINAVVDCWYCCSLFLFICCCCCFHCSWLLKTSAILMLFMVNWAQAQVFW